ncbi:P-type conjugative transfer protein TrbJ [Pseudomonas jinjuensis]|uniref:P-type conjugative transfer protein TrbJ n=1 Tax=Pseudomonas jinjuensis TaxID=198616 RepID=A0A1H0IX62_9PSED|nr:P-type conjugative transfer protein TrbJ [Pseudomonas jinjuensis]SDO36057.1 P-type conjugative transfer protein TrbJ [Pseudomonas jinjuensis]
MKILAAKNPWLLACIASSLISLNANAGIPVIDGGNLTQNVLTAMESVAQTLKQIEQYQTQLQQYENMLQNTAAPSVYIWDQASQTIDRLRTAIDTLDYYKRSLGSIDGYLGKFQDVAYYRASPCFSSAGCSEAEWAALDENRRLASESQKRANDALFRGLDQQQAALQHDATTLQQLQRQAQGATGQMQAIGYANQLASQQANQLLQIRGLLVAQQNAIATRMQAEADLEAKQQAAHAASTEGRIAPTQAPKNWLDMNR